MTIDIRVLASQWPREVGEVIKASNNGKPCSINTVWIGVMICDNILSANGTTPYLVPVQISFRLNPVPRSRVSTTTGQPSESLTRA